MTLSAELGQHAISLLGNPPGEPTRQATPIDLRRAVSASYYALFHRLSEAAVTQVAPNLQPMQAHRVHRWLDHAEMKRICGEFSAAHLRSPLRELIGDSCSEEMQTVSLSFIKLQEARHSSDYDPGFRLTWQQALELVMMAVSAIGAWERVAPSAESNIFILSLFLWKKWEIVRN